MLVKTCAVTQWCMSLLLHHTANLCLASPVCSGFQGLTLRLSCVQEAKQVSADRAHLMPVSSCAAAPPDPSARPRPLPPLLSRAPTLPELVKQVPPASVRHTPLHKSVSFGDHTISAAASSGQTHSLHRSVSDKQWSNTGAHEVFRAYHAAGLGSSSGMTAARSLVLDKSVGPLQPSGGRSGIMVTHDQVQETQHLSGVSAMLDKAVASREPSFSQGLGSAPPRRASSPSSDLKTEAGSGSLTAADGLLDEAQQLQQRPALGPPSLGFLSQQDSGTAELYDSMLGPMYEQHGGDSHKEGLAARLLRTASSASSSTFSSSSNAGQRSPAGIKAQYMSAAKASMQKLSANMQTRAGAAAEAFADGSFADKMAQKQQAFMQRASASDAAAVADRLAAKGQDVWRRAAASDAAAAASAKATMAAAKAAEGAASMSAVAQQWTAKSLQWGKTVSWFD